MQCSCSSQLASTSLCSRTAGCWARRGATGMLCAAASCTAPSFPAFAKICVVLGLHTGMDVLTGVICTGGCRVLNRAMGCLPSSCRLRSTGGAQHDPSAGSRGCPTEGRMLSPLPSSRPRASPHSPRAPTSPLPTRRGLKNSQDYFAGSSVSFFTPMPNISSSTSVKCIFPF